MPTWRREKRPAITPRSATGAGRAGSRLRGAPPPTHALPANVTPRLL